MPKNALILMVVLLLGITGCATAPPAPPAPRFHAPDLIVNKLWGWERSETPVELFESPDPKRFTLRLMSDGKAEVAFDCNRGSASYRIAERKLSFSPILSTTMTCPVQDLPLAYQLGKQLQRTTGFYLENGKLYLELPEEGGIMRFSELKP